MGVTFVKTFICMIIQTLQKCVHLTAEMKISICCMNYLHNSEQLRHWVKSFVQYPITQVILLSVSVTVALIAVACRLITAIFSLQGNTL